MPSDLQFHYRRSHIGCPMGGKEVLNALYSAALKDHSRATSPVARLPFCQELVTLSTRSGSCGRMLFAQYPNTVSNFDYP